MVSFLNLLRNSLNYSLKKAADHEEYATIRDAFGQQLFTNSFVIENTDPFNVITAPCVPMVLGTKRERLPDETVIRRSKMKCLNQERDDWNMIE